MLGYCINSSDFSSYKLNNNKKYKIKFNITFLSNLAKDKSLFVEVDFSLLLREVKLLNDDVEGPCNEHFFFGNKSVNDSEEVVAL